MSTLLFRANASTGEKVFTLIVIGTCVIAIYGMVSDFSPSDRVKELATYCALVCGGLATTVLLRDRHPGNRTRTFGFFKKVWFHAIAFLFACVFSWLAIGLGMASMANAVVGEPVPLKAHVVAIATPNHGKGCTYAFSVRYAADDGDSHKMCASEAYWESLRIGQEISVIHRQSVLGTKVLGFRRGV